MIRLVNRTVFDLQKPKSERNSIKATERFCHLNFGRLKVLVCTKQVSIVRLLARPNCKLEDFFCCCCLVLNKLTRSQNRHEYREHLFCLSKESTKSYYAMRFQVPCATEAHHLKVALCLISCHYSRREKKTCQL